MSRQDYKPHGLSERWVCQIIVCQSGGRGLLFTRSRLNNMLKTTKACWENFWNCFIMATNESSRLNACSQALMGCYSFPSADTQRSIELLTTSAKIIEFHSTSVIIYASFPSLCPMLLVTLKPVFSSQWTCDCLKDIRPVLTFFFPF